MDTSSHTPALGHLNTDIPELHGYDTGICLSNVDEMTVRLHRVSESLIAMLSELADAILTDAEGDSDTVDSILLSLLGERETPSPAASRLIELVSDVNRDLMGRLTAHMGLYDRLALYHLIKERHNHISRFNGESSPASTVSPTAAGRIAYMPSAFADKAYLRFADHVENCRAATHAGFSDACEEVRGGLCEYCILPLESSADGKLLTFSSLILHYGLRIVAVCDLASGIAADHVTRFALLRLATDEWAAAPSIPPLGGSEQLSVELLHVTASTPLSELLIAADFCRMSLLRADTLPRDAYAPTDADATDTPPVCVVLRADAHSDLTTFLRYLSLDAADDRLIGIYPTW